MEPTQRNRGLAVLLVTILAATLVAACGPISGAIESSGLPIPGFNTRTPTPTITPRVTQTPFVETGLIGGQATVTPFAQLTANPVFTETPTPTPSLTPDIPRPTLAPTETPRVAVNIITAPGISDTILNFRVTPAADPNGTRQKTWESLRDFQDLNGPYRAAWWQADTAIEMAELLAVVMYSEAGANNPPVADDVAARYTWFCGDVSENCSRDDLLDFLSAYATFRDQTSPFGFTDPAARTYLIQSRGLVITNYTVPGVGSGASENEVELGAASPGMDDTLKNYRLINDPNGNKAAALQTLRDFANPVGPYSQAWWFADDGQADIYEVISAMLQIEARGEIRKIDQISARYVWYCAGEGINCGGDKLISFLSEYAVWRAPITAPGGFTNANAAQYQTLSIEIANQ